MAVHPGEATFEMLNAIPMVLLVDGLVGIDRRLLRPEEVDGILLIEWTIDGVSLMLSGRIPAVLVCQTDDECSWLNPHPMRTGSTMRIRIRSDRKEVAWLRMETRVLTL